MTQEQIDRTKDNIFKRGANANMRYNSAQYGNLDIYQVCHPASLGAVWQPRHPPGAPPGLVGCSVHCSGAKY
jgi:hypothetical protein